MLIKLLINSLFPTLIVCFVEKFQETLNETVLYREMTPLAVCSSIQWSQILGCTVIVDVATMKWP